MTDMIKPVVVTPDTFPGITQDAATGDLLFESPAAFQSYADARLRAYDAARQANHGKPPGGATPPCMYVYKNLIYDITEFVAAHPGGQDILLDYNGKDVSVTFHDEYNHHAHTHKALNMMLQYRVGRLSQRRALDDLERYQQEELTAYPRMTEKELVYKDFTIRRDRGLIWQAMFLSLPQYMHLINTPIFVPTCRLFDTAFLEPFSKTKYWLVALLWLPLSLFWLLRGMLRDYSQIHEEWGSVLDPYLYWPNKNVLFQNYPATVTEAMAASYVPAAAQASAAATAEAQYQHALEVSKFNPMNIVLLFSSGVLLWTLTEYFVHRMVFHFERAIPAAAMNTPVCKLLHLVLHGIHHIIPMDPDRLVFPPVLFIVASTIIYNAFALLLNGSFLDILAAGVVFGYVCYDEIHYYIHHTDPKDFYFKDLKKYHHAHHYVDDTKGYGISVKLWDIVFGTTCKKN